MPVPQEWGHAEMTRWMDGETWRRRDEEAGEREMGDGGDGELGGWGIVLRASKLPERVSLCMRRKCVVVARCTTAQAECLRVVHARAFLDLCTRAQFFWVFKLFSVGGAGPCAIFRFCLRANVYAPRAQCSWGDHYFHHHHHHHTHETHETHETHNEPNQNKCKPKCNPNFACLGTKTLQ